MCVGVTTEAGLKFSSMQLKDVWVTPADGISVPGKQRGVCFSAPLAQTAKSLTILYNQGKPEETQRGRPSTPGVTQDSAVQSRALFFCFR